MSMLLYILKCDLKITDILSESKCKQYYYCLIYYFKMQLDFLEYADVEIS